MIKKISAKEIDAVAEKYPSLKAAIDVIKKIDGVDTLYPSQVEAINSGYLDGKSLILAFLAGVTQYFQARYMPQPATSSATSGSFQESFAKSMNMQMKYIFPVLIAFIAYTVSGAVALYFIASNLFAIGQQIYVDKKRQDLVIKL